MAKEPKAKKYVEETKEQRDARYSMPHEHFYWLGLINDKKMYRNVEELKQYPGFMVNKGLSYYADTVLVANQMNMNGHLGSRLQFDFMYSMIPKGKRYEKWLKPDKEENIMAIQECYTVSRTTAREMLDQINSMSDADDVLADIMNRINRGGRQKSIRNTE
jgi:hypothetical protein